MLFSEYCSAIVGCYSIMHISERDELHAWEAQRVDGSGLYGTSDWPGWEKYIGKFERRSRAETNTDTYGYVYLVQADTGQCKIGSSKDVVNRIRQLQCANPGTLTLLHQLPSINAQRDEFTLHERFAHKRVRNEWFALTDTDVEAIRSAGHENGSLILTTDKFP